MTLPTAISIVSMRTSGFKQNISWYALVAVLRLGCSRSYFFLSSAMMRHFS